MHPQEEEKEEEFIYHKYTYTSNFRLIYVSDGLPKSYSRLNVVKRSRS